jgi:hypothetical protein
MNRPALFSLLVVALGTSSAAGQTTVQLPSVHVFATDSSVLVPDQGTVVLGGVNSAASGRSQFGGLPNNRSLGTQRSASGVTVSAKIHDMEAYDRALLAEAANRRQAVTTGSLATTAPRSASGPSGDAPRASVAEIEAARQAEPVDPAREAQAYFAKAEQARVEGKPRLARVYYQMASRRASGPLKQRALAGAAAVGAELASAGDAKTAARQR